MNPHTREISPDRGNHATTIPATMLLMLKLSPVFPRPHGLWPSRQNCLTLGRCVPVMRLRCRRDPARVRPHGQSGHYLVAEPEVKPTRVDGRCKLKRRRQRSAYHIRMLVQMCPHDRHSSALTMSDT